MRTLVPIFAKALKITHLLVVKEAQIRTTRTDNRPLEFQGVFHTLVIARIDLVDVGLIATVDALRFCITCKGKIADFID
ncbi:hypothetical protein APB19_02815 [Pseudomonas aeruginosa]|nr:hypothetical protein APB19_02815 [Pseudomonas aeruginosa]